MSPDEDARRLQRPRRDAPGDPSEAAQRAAAQDPRLGGRARGPRGLRSASGILGRLALAGASCCLSVGAAELAARLCLPPPRYHREPVQFDPELGFRGIPGYRAEGTDAEFPFPFELNEQGLRGRPLPAPGTDKPPGTERILFVGDSFLVGRAVGELELVTSRVDAALRERGRSAEVFNLSSVDWGTGQEILALRSLAADIVADRVVLFLYPANDLVNNLKDLAGRTIVSPGDRIRPYLVPEAGGPRIEYLHPQRAAWRRHSRFFATAERALLSFGIGESAGDARAGRGALPREDLEIFRSHTREDVWERAWQRTFALLRIFRDDCQARGSRLLVVVVPSVFQVARTAKFLRLDIEAQLLQRRPLDRIADWNLPERRLRSFFDSERIDFRLLLPELRAASAAGLAVYARDEHLSAEGFAVAERVVVEWLEGNAALDSGTLEGAPVRILPPAGSAPARLDFRRERHTGPLGDGWFSWRPEAPGADSGWRIGARALALLPDREGDLVFAGSVQPGPPFPLQGQLAILGDGRFPFRIEGPGSFQLRFPASRSGGRARVTSDGYFALQVSIPSLAVNSAAAESLRISELGIEAASPPRLRGATPRPPERPAAEGSG